MNNQEIIKNYIESSISQKNASQLGDYKQNNKLIRKRVTILKTLIENNQLNSLLALLTHSDINVRLWAAFDLSANNLFLKECKLTLKKIIDEDKGIIGWGAEETYNRLNKK